MAILFRLFNRRDYRGDRYFDRIMGADIGQDNDPKLKGSDMTKLDLKTIGIVFALLALSALVFAGEPQNVDLKEIPTETIQATLYRLLMNVSQEQAWIQAGQMELERRQKAQPQPSPTPQLRKTKK